jgi:allantoinase
LIAYDLVIRASRAITAEGQVPVAVAVKDGKIAALLPIDAEVDARESITIDGVLLPGLVDTHVHINEPGRTEWEGFETATRAAALGGVTTLIDMPLNSIPPTVSVEALQIKRSAAIGKCSVDVGFWGGSIPGNVADLQPLHDEGVFGFKCFLLHSGVDEFPATPEADLRSALTELARLGALMIVHAEDPETIAQSPAPASRNYDDFLNSRPKEAENIAITTLIKHASETGTRVHVLHLSSADAVPLIAKARTDGIAITAETCPHYLSLSAEEISDGATDFKCCPPIREAANRDQLWRALADGAIDFIASDHSPCTPELKELEIGDFQSAWGGISSLQLGLPIIWTEASQRGIALERVVEWMATQPAAFAGLDTKGAIEVGRDADLIAFDPDAEQQIDPQRLEHRNPITPYAGKTLRGVVTSTWLRGTLIAEHGEVVRPVQGQLLRRVEAVGDGVSNPD